MSTITTRDGTRLYYKDWGTGRPLVFSHGWPLTADAWDTRPARPPTPLRRGGCSQRMAMRQPGRLRKS
jgi:pimeloyl-ACP methyl ester carboxylesterase